MGESKKASGSKKISDVAKPGKSTPPSSSRPVLVTNRPIMKDPMVVDDEPAEEKNEPIKTPKKGFSGEVKIEPLATSPVANTDVEAENIGDTESEESKIETAVGKKESAEIAPTNDELEENSKAKATEKPPAVVNEEEAKKAAQQEAAIEKLIDSKQYFLPINAVEKRRSKQFVAAGILLSILLAVVWADIALDAGLIKLDSVEPLTHFFSN